MSCSGLRDIYFYIPDAEADCHSIVYCLLPSLYGNEGGRKTAKRKRFFLSALRCTPLPPTARTPLAHPRPPSSHFLHDLFFCVTCDHAVCPSRNIFIACSPTCSTVIVG